MTRSTYLTITMLLLSAMLFAQSRSTLKGTVLDSVSKSPVEFVTVAIVNAKDTSLISYTITNKNGIFSLTGVPSNRETKLIISAMGYSTFRKVLVFTPGEVKDIGALYLTNKLLNEVIVKGERTPIIQKKDTLEFSTEAFKTRPNALVEDLLRLLPGVQVDNDGTINVNGKVVNKLLIDGKRFFGSDPKVATKNLDADLVADIQVYDDRDEDPDHKLSDMEVGKIINLKLKKKIKKSTIGKVYGGVGTRDRYEAGGILSSFRDTLQISLIGVANNLSRTGFSSSDLNSMGGLDRSGGSQAYDGTLGGRGSGLENFYSGGLNINNDYGKKLKTNLNYFYSTYTRDYKLKSFNEQTLPTTLLSTLSENVQRTKMERHSIGGLLEWTPDTVIKVRYDVKFNVTPSANNYYGTSNSFNTQFPKLVDAIGNGSSNGIGHSFTHSFSYYRKLKRNGESIYIGQTLNLSNSGSDALNYTNLTSYTPSIPSSIYDRYTNNDYVYDLAGVAVTYTRPISKLITNEFFANVRYWETSTLLSSFNKNTASNNYDLFLSAQSNNLKRTAFIENFKNQFIFQLNKKTTLRLGLDLEIQNVIDRFGGTVKDLGKGYTWIFPVFKLNGAGYSVNYGEWIDQPEISQMQPIVREYNQLYKATGNPNLLPSRQHQFSANYFKYNYDKQLSINSNGSLSFVDNNVVQSQTRDAVGVTTTTFVNRNGGWRANLGINVGKQLKKSQKWQIGLNNGISSNFNKGTFFFNAEEGTQTNYNLNFTEGLNFNYNSVVTLNTSYTLSDQITKYKGVNYANVSTLKHIVSSEFTIKASRKVIFDGRYDYSYNPQVSAGFPRSANIVNLAVSFLMLKENRGQLKLSVYDLFDQNITVYRYAANNAITTGEQQVLKRYFLINYQYKFTSHK
jgi:hypothetical protein